MPKKKTDTQIPISTVRHNDKRVNIPTEELRGFVAEDEARPRTVLYPRDPSLDPQLVWKGKDEQDRQDLAIPAVPVYIQEKIHPQAIIENVRAEAKKETPEMQIGLFSDFNGIKFEELIDFYQHEQNWTNRMVLGDSLLVMTSLAEKEGLKGKVQMIYFDPPYGIKFGSNWQVSTRKRDVKDGKAEDLTRQPEQIRAFRDTWKLGIHSYLAYLRDRLTVARELLTETGSVFVQIGDENVHLVRCIMDEVFGSENFVSIISFVTTSSQTSKYLPTVCDYIVWYAKNKDQMKFRQLYESKELGGAGGTKYNRAELPDGTRLTLNEAVDSIDESTLRSAKIYRIDTLTSQSGGEGSRFPVKFRGSELVPRSGFWKTNQEGMKRLIFANRIEREGISLGYIRYLDDFPAYPRGNVWADFASVQSRTDPKVYVVQTATKVVERCMHMTTDPGDLVLDPTMGSGTTAYVAEQWGRRWITCDTSRVSLALARTRLMAARYPYYILSDSSEGVRKEAELFGKIPSNPPLTKGGAAGWGISGDIKKGFIYKRVPHVTLKSIANNPDIKEGMIREEIDAAIAKHAETETLYDQPYEDNKRIRVTGPFTVESLSPHRVLAADEERPKAEIEAQKAAGVGQFETMILENLKKAGVQNTVKNERLKFDRLEPYAGEWLHAAGEYTETHPHPDPLPEGEGKKGKMSLPEGEGVVRRVAVCIGPEHGTVGAELIKEAAKEALRGVGFDLLVICGFAFDAHAGETVKEFTPAPHKPTLTPTLSLREMEKGGGARENPVVAEDVKKFGKLPVLLARMNPDLAMGDELLKKTGAGNLFMVFGEPDIKIEKGKGGKITAEIRGVDVYDPTTGQIRSSSTDDIACWFIDTNYNSESFFVRHAYFTGADEPYEKLKRALRAEVDESAWSSLYSTKSRPFDPPKTGKIAVKVINHYGDEVLKVYEIGGIHEKD
jgi:adenine-specific DNA-methyltransferase